MSAAKLTRSQIRTALKRAHRRDIDTKTMAGAALFTIVMVVLMIMLHIVTAFITAFLGGAHPAPETNGNESAVGVTHGDKPPREHPCAIRSPPLRQCGS